jgi:uncharacterized Zn finger protein (UPF0148 family)
MKFYCPICKANLQQKLEGSVYCFNCTYCKFNTDVSGVEDYIDELRRTMWQGSLESWYEYEKMFYSRKVQI